MQYKSHNNHSSTGSRYIVSRILPSDDNSSNNLKNSKKNRTNSQQIDLVIQILLSTIHSTSSTLITHLLARVHPKYYQYYCPYDSRYRHWNVRIGLVYLRTHIHPILSCFVCSRRTFRPTIRLVQIVRRDTRSTSRLRAFTCRT